MDRERFKDLNKGYTDITNGSLDPYGAAIEAYARENPLGDPIKDGAQQSTESTSTTNDQYNSVYNWDDERELKKLDHQDEQTRRLTRNAINQLTR